MSEEQPIQVPVETPESKLGFYARWRERTYGWLNQRAPQEVADVVLLLPDMMAFAVRLVQDNRVPLSFRAQLAMSIVYVLLPFDLIPELALGTAGLADDAVVLSLLLYRLMEYGNGVDSEVLRDNWPGKGDIAETIREVVEDDGELAGLLRRARNLVGNPDPQTVNSQPEGKETHDDQQ